MIKSTLVPSLIKRKNCSKAKVLTMERNPAGERNKQPILDVLTTYIANAGKTTMLEVSSGPGLHSGFFASHFPNLTIQTSEYDKNWFPSIGAYKSHFGVSNVIDPVFLDISSEVIDLWPAGSFDFILSINMIHITPWACSLGLFRHASKFLKPNGILFTYGSYMKHGILEPESNVRFNQHLKSNNPAWGIRDIDDLCDAAGKVSIELIAEHDLPSNNKLLVWQKK